MSKVWGLVFCACLMFFISCGGGSSVETADKNDGISDSDSEKDDSESDNQTEDAGSDENEGKEAEDGDSDAEGNDDPEELQTGGIYIFSDFDGSENAQSREILGNGGFFGFSIVTLGEKYWAASAIHESIPAFDWEKATGKFYIFDKSKRIGSREDAVLVLNHPDKSLNVAFGYTAAEPCDINGDGFDDLAVSSHLAPFGSLSAAGEIVVFYGSPDGWNEKNTSISRLSSAYIQQTDSMSQSLTCFDYDGDGFADVFAGGQNAGPELQGGGSQGMVAIFKGSEEGLWEIEATVILPKIEKKAQYFGSGMLTGDFNGDSKHDLVIAGWGLKEDDSSANSGGVYIYLSGDDWMAEPSKMIFGEAGTQFGSMIKVVEIAGKKHLGVLAAKEGKHGAIHIYETENFNETAVITIPEMTELGDGTLNDFDTIKISENSDLLIAGGKTFGSGGMILCAKIENGGFGNIGKCPFQPESPEGGFGYSVKNIGNGEIVVGKPEYIHKF